MPRRTILTERQRQALFGLPTDKAILFRHYVLSDQDIEVINRRRRPENKLGFALQLCVLRYPGRLLQPGEEIPTELIEFVGSQIGLSTDELLTYGQRKQTRYQHSTSLKRLYGYTKFDLKNDSRFRAWLKKAAEQASSNEGFAKTVTEELRKHKIIVPAPSTLERLCADSLVAAENRITKRIASKLDNAMKERLLSLLEETLPQKITRFVWLRQFEAGNNSRAINLLMDRLDCLNEIALPPKVLVNVPHHRISRLRRQGERYYADGMRDLPDHRRLAILAVCVIEWKSQLSDSIIESHDRIVGKLYRASERARDTQISEQRNLIHHTLKSFADVGKKLVAAQENGESLERVIETKCGWEKFSGMVDNAVDLNRTVAADPLDFVSSGYLRFRRYIPRLLKNLDIKADRAGKPLLLAVDKLRHLNETGNTKPLVDPPIEFARPKWRARLRRRKSTDRKFWEIAVLFSLRDGFRSGDIWLEDGREFARLPAQLIPIEAVMKSNSLAVPYDVNDWLNQRKIMLEQAFSAGGEAVRCNRLPNSTIVNGELQFTKLKRNIPVAAEEVITTLYKQMNQVRITDILLDVNRIIGFSEAFTDLRTGIPCRDEIGLLTVLLGNGINLGLTQMSAASTTHSYWELLRIARWYIEDGAYERALAMIVDAQHFLPMARYWGLGQTSSSDGQFFPTGGQGEAMNLINIKHGITPGIKAYSHLSDQFAAFAIQLIPSTAHEAPYILDGLYSNETGRRIREHYADTGGFTDHVFAMCSILGYIFSPRIRDLPSKRLYSFASIKVDREIQPLVAGNVNEKLIIRNWPDILRAAASIASGTIKPSQLLKCLSSYSRQNELAVALREVGRVERSLFMLNWMMDEQQQRRTQMGLNKGEAHHALKRALSFYQRGEIRDRSSEGQHYRISGMNLLAAIVIFWNTLKLGEIVEKLKSQGQSISPELLAHTSPLGWEHIILTGEYRWPNA